MPACLVPVAALQPAYRPYPRAAPHRGGWEDLPDVPVRKAFLINCLFPTRSTLIIVRPFDFLYSHELANK